MARQGFFPYYFAAARTHVIQMSCTRLGPLKDALPTELQRRGYNIYNITKSNNRIFIIQILKELF